MANTILWKIAEIGIVIILVTLLSCVPVCLLWNWLMPTIFGLGNITLPQSLGLCFLCNLLFNRVSSGKD